MLFNTDITKQTQEIAFSQKKNDPVHPILCFNNAEIQRQSYQKFLAFF